MKHTDTLNLTIDCTYSNIGAEWVAEAVADDGAVFAYAKAQSRPDALRELADQLDEMG